jgi:uncharacterized MAPEG superfamily protein
MTTEALMLAATGGLLLLLTLIQGTRNVLVLGLPTAAGNQHDIAPWAGWNDRLNRAIRNLIEAIAIFAPIVIAVQISGLNNETTAMGAQIFVIARLAHAVVYTLGVPWVRTAAWFMGVVGIIMVGSPLLG